MRDFDVVRFLYCFRINSKAVVLGGDLAFAANKVLDGVIQPTMAVMHLERWNIVCQREELVAKADSEYRFIFREYLPEGVDCVSHGGRVTGTVRNKIPGRFKLPDLRQFCFCRKYFHKSTTFHHALKNVLFDAIVQHRYAHR